MLVNIAYSYVFPMAQSKSLTLGRFCKTTLTLNTINIAGWRILNTFASNEGTSCGEKIGI